MTTHAQEAPGPQGLGTGRKLALSAAALAAAAAVAVTGTSASFTASVSRGHSVTTGVPVLVLGAAGTLANRLGVDAAGLVPGRTVQRAFDITNAGSAPFDAIALTAVATTTSLLDTDRTNGLQVRLEACSVPWTETGTAPDYAYACAGTRTEVLPSRPVLMAAVPVPGLHALQPGGTDHLLLTEMLPDAAGNAFQNQTSALTFTFTAG